jgi:hypothetical protein
MKILPPLLLALALGGCATAKAPAAVRTGDALRAELLSMEAQDQALRGAAPLDFEAIVASDAAHTARIKAILSAQGWPPASLVGSDGASAFWLLVQHADADPAFQRAALELMRPMVAAGEAKPQHFAYLWDRTHSPQRYGTQGKCAGPKDWRPHPIENPGRVDAERSQMKLPPLAEYVAMASEICGAD